MFNFLSFYISTAGDQLQFFDLRSHSATEKALDLRRDLYRAALWADENADSLVIKTESGDLHDADWLRACVLVKYPTRSALLASLTMPLRGAHGEELWWRGDVLHREDGPAVRYANGEGEWHFNGQLHREGGPAVENGSYQAYYVRGRNHREDGPARIQHGVFEAWLIDGKLHRVDGPAIVFVNGHREWFRNGERHRIDGPALIQSDGYSEWWVNGVLVNPPVSVA